MSSAPSRPSKSPPQAPLGDRDIRRLAELADALPPPLEPLDPSALDGFLVGVLLQPQPVPEPAWLAHVADLDARPAPPGPALSEMHALARRRHAELARAIAARRWFDPWVFAPDEAEDEDSAAALVLPWVAGFAAALENFPALLAAAGAGAREPLAALYRHFDADDLEDVDDELRAEIDALGPAETAAEAVEDLVRSTLLLADELHPRPVSAARTRRR